ncbi:hypothetical protein ACQVGM_16890, partial [Escherichia coli]
MNKTLSGNHEFPLDLRCQSASELIRLKKILPFPGTNHLTNTGCDAGAPHPAFYALLRNTLVLDTL